MSTHLLNLFPILPFPRLSPSLRYDLVAASWTHEEDANKVLNRKDLPDVVLVRKVSTGRPDWCALYSPINV